MNLEILCVGAHMDLCACVNWPTCERVHARIPPPPLLWAGQSCVLGAQPLSLLLQSPGGVRTLTSTPSPGALPGLAFEGPVCQLFPLSTSILPPF